MKLSKDAFLVLPGEGRLTLQIPEFDISIDPNTRKMTISTGNVEYPDEWFVRLTASNIPCTGKQKGFLHLSRTGYRVNKDRIRQAFCSSKTQRGTWAEFELEAEKHFEDVETAIRKKVARLEKSMGELKKSVKKT